MARRKPVAIDLEPTDEDSEDYKQFYQFAWDNILAPGARQRTSDLLTDEMELGKWPGDEQTTARIGRATSLGELSTLTRERRGTYDQLQKARKQEAEFRAQDPNVFQRGVQAVQDFFTPEGAVRLDKPSALTFQTAPTLSQPSLPTQPPTPDEVVLEVPEVRVTAERPTPSTGRFQVEDGEIIDTQTRQIITPDQFNRLSTDQDKAEIERQLRAAGVLEDAPDDRVYSQTIQRDGQWGNILGHDPLTPDEEATAPFMGGKTYATEEEAAAAAADEAQIDYDRQRRDPTSQWYNPALQPQPRSVREALTQASNNFFQSIGTTGADMIKWIAVASKELDAMLPELLQNPAEVEDRFTYKLGQSLERLAKRRFPSDPQAQKEFLIGVLPQAAGSMVTFLAGGVAGALAKAPVAAGTAISAVMGSMAGGADQYEDAKEHGANEETRRKAFWLGSAVGSTEALPIAGVLNRFNKATGGKFFTILKETGVTAAQEFIQEWSQQVGSNVIAQQLYDEHRGWFENAGISAEAGGVIGAVTGFLSGILQGRKARKQHANQEGAQHTSPFVGEPPDKPAPHDFTAPIPEQLELAKRPPFLIKPQPQAAPDLAPGLVPTTPEPAPAVSMEGGRPMSVEPQIIPESIPQVAPPSDTPLPPLPPDLAPVMERPPIVPATPDMAPIVTEPGAGLTDRTDTEPAAQGLGDIGQAGRSMIDNMYEAMWQKTQAGETKEGGHESVYLQAAKPVYQAGGFKDIEAFKAFVKEIEGVVSPEMGLKGKQRNDEIRRVISEWIPSQPVEQPEVLVRPGFLGDELFTGDFDEGLSRIFLSDSYTGDPVPLVNVGFLPEEVQALEEAGLATDGRMSERQFQEWMKERSARLKHQDERFKKRQERRKAEKEEPKTSTEQSDVLELPDVVVKGERPTQSYSPPTPEAQALMPTSAPATLEEAVQEMAPIERERLAERLEEGKAKKKEDRTPLPDYVQDNINQEFERAKRLGVVDKILDLAADGKVAQQIATELNVDKDLVRAVRAHEGVPSADQEGFREWANKRKASRRTPTPESVIDHAAQQAATSPENALPQPTEAQKQAGNYQKGHVRIAGLDISIENPAGSTRSGKDKSGKPWSVTMKSHYGYIRGTEGKDKDHIDLFIKPGTPEDYSGTVYIVDQNQPGTKAFDEHKIIFGASSIEDAKQLYRENYAKNWTGLGAISALPMREFKDWLQSGDTKKPFHRQDNPFTQRKVETPEQAVETSPEIQPAPTPEKIEYTVQSLRPGAKPETLTVPATHDTVATAPQEGATIQAPTPEEATNERPQQPRVEDSRPPEAASPENVPGVEERGPAESVRPRAAKPGERPADRARAPRDVSPRSDGDAARSDLPADRGGRAESGRDVETVQRPDDDLPAGTDFTLAEDFAIPSGQKGKYKANVDAIRLLKRIESEGRLATLAEQAILARYTGWGGLPQAFQWSPSWKNEYDQLRDLLTEEEYDAARASTPNAHYTDPATIRAIYRGLQHLGFKGGRLLEPGAGVGHFFGAMPVDLASRSRRTAVEKDALSARIAKQLYQRANVIEGEYQQQMFPDNFFDVAVGNVPFADVKIFDPHNKDLSKLNLSLHDYYFAKALTQIRPGGIVAFITSRYTMDKVNGKLRDYIATKADLLGAIRLPNTQFKEIANTDVTTDIIVLQRREDNTPAAGEAWAKVDHTVIGDRPATINEYFIRHPEQIMGRLSMTGTMYRDNEITVENDGRDMAAALDEAFKRMPEKVLRPRERPKATTQRGLLEALQASDDVKDGAYTIQNNALYVRRGSQFVPVQDATPTDLERAKGLIGLREQVREVFKTQLDESSEKTMADARTELNKRYDRFVKKWGPVNGRANKGLFREDPDYPTLQALEKDYDPKANTAKKADIFTKRVIEYRPRALKADSPKEAMLASLNETGRIEWDRMAELTGQTPEEMQRELKGLVFKDPSGDWESADAYLSGNIRQKLKAAQAAAKIDKRYQENVEALEKVIPEDLKPAQIDVKIGHGWIPTDVYQDFIAHLFDVSRDRVKVSYNAHVGAYAVTAPIGLGNTKNDTVYGTQRYKGFDILQDALASKLPTVYDLLPDDKRVVNQKETFAAREKLQKMQEEFRKWLWDDAARAKRLARLYNDEFNNVRIRDYDGSHLTLPGVNPAITLRPHQKNAIWRALQSGNTLLAHVVGAGKTFTMVGIAMEARRLRIANKPMFVVPNHLVEQWRDAILQLYPAAKVLTPAKSDFEAANRRKLVGRIATGDWDAVVVAHSQMTKIPVSIETFEQFVTEQVAILEDYLNDLKTDKKNNRNVIKEIEKAKERLETKLERRKAEIAERADAGVSFEETGVDMLLVDEADLFKNLWFPTRMTRVAGLPNTESQRSYDLFLKTQYLNKLTGQRSVHFATGTPISNSMAEVFTMQRYLQPHALEAAGLQHFDTWARQFGNVVTSMELAPDGSGYRPRSRFAEFVNVPELTQMFRQVMDVKNADDLKLPVPNLRTGKPINVTTKPGEALKEYTKTLIERAAKLKSGKVDPRVDNMLKITGDGRNAALDVRLRVPGAPEDKNGKVVRMVNQVYEEWERTKDVKGTQLVFLDLSTPKGEGKAKKAKTEEEDAPAGEVELAEETALRGSVYQDIKRKLIKKGIPEKEIAFIHDADTDAKKAKLFADVNAGNVRVLIGSTEKMGAGTNVQERAVALHNLDAPWRPRDLEQRIGRIVRQGNKLYEADPEGFEVAVFNYATEAPSFDVYMWQTIEAKAKTIVQIMKGDPNVRTIQDVDAQVLTYSEMKAIASGNPMILERVNVETELTKLNLLKSQDRDSKATMKFTLATLPGLMRENEKKAEAIKKDQDYLSGFPEDPLAITIDSVKYDDAEAAGNAILQFVKDATSTKRSDPTDVTLGTYRGFNMRLKVYLDNDAQLILERTGSTVRWLTTTFTKDAKADGLIARLNNALGKMDEEGNIVQRALEKDKKREAELKVEIDKPFEKEDRIAKLAARLAEIDKALDLTNKDEGIAGSEGPKEDTGLGILKSERGSIPASLLTRDKGPKYGKEAATYRKQRAQEEIGFTSADPDIEARVRAAKQGLKPASLPERLKEHTERVWHLVSREFEHLPDTALFAPLRTDLLRLQKYKGIAADKIQRDLAAIIKPLSRQQYDQLEWKALLSDLQREAEQGHALPFGYTPEQVQEDLDRLNAVMDRDAKVSMAWVQRQLVWDRIKNDYQTAMEAIGFDVSKKLTKDDYFRHQVLEYAQQRAVKGTGSKVRTPTGRGFLKSRQGSTFDINANYVQAEFEVMAQMVYDTQLAKVIKGVDDQYNIRKGLEQEAKARNNEAIQELIDQGGLEGAMIQEAMKDFRKRIGMHMSKIRGVLGLPKGARVSLPEIAAMAEDPDHEANASARGVFKAINERKAFVEQVLGPKYLTWDQLIPEGYDLWQPREGNIFYLADSIPAHLAKALQEAMLTEAGFPVDKLRKVLAMGGPREQYVIPVEAKATLDSLRKPEPNWFVEMNRQLLGHWKQLMLIAPRKVLRYNLRNLSGDADALFVGNASAFKKLPQAAQELIPVIFGDAPLTGEAKQWAERGGYGTTLQVQELGDLNDLKAFKTTLDRASQGGWTSIPAKVWNQYWKAARLSTDYRESMMRYAAYLDYLEQMRAGNGKPKNYGASKKDTVLALSDVRDRAFKLANELLGAYDRVSVAGQTIRNFWVPFYSWWEVNATRYYRLVANALDQGHGGKVLAKGAVVTGKNAAAFLIKLSAFWAALQAWNYLMYGDDEDELRETNPTVANRPHLLFGRDADGKIRYLAGIGALGDLLSWFGLDAFPGLVGDIMHDRMTLGEAFKQTVKAPVNKVWQGLTPMVKLPLELAVRESTYPDVFNPRPIQDRVDYLGNQVTLGPEVQAWRGKPGKPLYGMEDLTGLVVQRTDPKAAAYGTWHGIERKYLERMGKDSPAIFWRSPRGEALQNWARALRDEDTKAETFWKGEYERLEREKMGKKFSQAEMWKDIEKSLHAKAPLAGVSKAERDSILKSLDDTERRTLARAEEYYKDTLLQVLPPSRRRHFLDKERRLGWVTRPHAPTPESVLVP